MTTVRILNGNDLKGIGGMESRRYLQKVIGILLMLRNKCFFLNFFTLILGECTMILVSIYAEIENA